MDITLQMINQQMQSMAQDRQNFEQTLANNKKVDAVKELLNKTEGETSAKEGKTLHKSPQNAQQAYLQAVVTMMQDNLGLMASHAQRMQSQDLIAQRDEDQLTKLSANEAGISKLPSGEALAKQTENNVSMTLLNADIGTQGTKQNQESMALNSASSQNSAEAANAQMMIQTVVNHYVSRG